MADTTRIATPDEIAAFLELGRALGGLPAGDEPPLSLTEAIRRAAERAARHADTVTGGAG